jgi:fatty acid CoA ligase FadD9
MSIDTREERLARRIADLYATDQQFADARPSDAITLAVEQPGLRLPEMVRTVMEGYAERPALGERAVHLVEDPQTGRTSLELLPRFETVSYRELWERAGAVANAFTANPTAPVRPGERVCVLGFASLDYTVIDVALVRIGAVCVPLQTSAPVAQLRPIVAETEPSMIAASVDNLADAIELMLTGHACGRLVVFDYRPAVTAEREAFEAARARLADAGSPVVVETLGDVLERGKALPAAPVFISDDDDPLTLLIYTSGSTGAPKGAMYLERQVINTWSGLSRAAWGQQSAQSSITLSFWRRDHPVGGR